MDENDLFNPHETHFLFNMNNGRTIGFKGEIEVNYAEVVSGGQEMTVLVRFNGVRDPQISAYLMVFLNKDRHYPIIGTLDIIPGVA